MLWMATMCQSNEESLAPSQGMEMEVPGADQDGLVSVYVSDLLLHAWGLATSPQPSLYSWDPLGSPWAAVINQCRIAM